MLPANLPPAIARLPRDARGYPIPWFVVTLPDGTRDLRFAAGDKRHQGYRDSLCWICGGKLSKDKVFVGGTFSCTNRVFGDWASHPECAMVAAQLCPVLNGTMVRRSSKPIPESIKGAEVSLPGNMVELSPWVGLYLTRKPVRMDENELFRPGPPKRIAWWHNGEPMTDAEIKQHVLPRIERIRAFVRGELKEVNASDF